MTKETTTIGFTYALDGTSRSRDFATCVKGMEAAAKAKISASYTDVVFD